MITFAQAAVAGITLALLTACGSPQTPAPPPASVAVTTSVPERGSLPRIQTTYGTVAPAANGVISLSLQVDGRGARLYVTPGEHVTAGQPLVEFELSAGARAAYAQAVTGVSIARETQARTARLLGQQLATEAQREQADKALGDAETALAALNTDYGAWPKRTVTAPSDGVIARCPEAEGARVAPGAELVSMTRAGGLLVTVGVETTRRADVHAGDAATLHSLNGQGIALKGHVVRIDQIVNPASRLVDVDVSADGPVLQGDAYQVDIVAGEAAGWRIPLGAVLHDDQGAYVFQIAAQKAVRVAVKPLVDDGQSVVVNGDIDAGRPLVTLGNYQLSDGTLTRPMAPAR
jgi:RND family efflux transporter MFP subunit